MKKNILCLLVLLSVVGCVSNRGPDAADSNLVLIKTSKGDIRVQLDSGKAPISTANFLEYVDAGFYDGVVFHRVIPDFMIQGGGFSVDSAGGLQRKAPRPPILLESRNGLKNRRGTIAMARQNVPDSGTSQFFINLKNNSRLDFPSFDGHGYAVFGEVVKGMRTVDAIAGVQTGRAGFMNDVPEEPVIIKSITRIAR